jgi:hypothetical protein
VRPQAVVLLFLRARPTRCTPDKVKRAGVDLSVSGDWTCNAEESFLILGPMLQAFGGKDLRGPGLLPEQRTCQRATRKAANGTRPGPEAPLGVFCVVHDAANDGEVGGLRPACLDTPPPEEGHRLRLLSCPGAAPRWLVRVCMTLNLA